jgi:hypothetical protein
MYCISFILGGPQTASRFVSFYCYDPMCPPSINKVDNNNNNNVVLDS